MWIASDKTHLIVSGDKEGQCDQEIFHRWQGI